MKQNVWQLAPDYPIISGLVWNIKNEKIADHFEKHCFWMFVSISISVLFLRIFDIFQSIFFWIFLLNFWIFFKSEFEFF